MAKKIGEIEITLASLVIEGWDSCIDELNYRVLGLAVGLGYDLPAIDVVFEKGVYRLLSGQTFFVNQNGGGHTRAMVAMDYSGKIKCNVYDKHRIFGRKTGWRPVSEIRMLRNTDYGHLDRVRHNLSYLPEDVASNFVEENGLIWTEDGRLVDRVDYINFLNSEFTLPLQ